MYKIFFSLEKFRAKQKTITRFKKSDGSFTNDNSEILEECRNFYKKLFKQGLKSLNPRSSLILLACGKWNKYEVLIAGAKVHFL